MLQTFLVLAPGVTDVTLVTVMAAVVLVAPVDTLGGTWVSEGFGFVAEAWGVGLAFAFGVEAWEVGVAFEVTSFFLTSADSTAAAGVCGDTEGCLKLRTPGAVSYRERTL